MLMLGLSQSETPRLGNYSALVNRTRVISKGCTLYLRKETLLLSDSQIQGHKAASSGFQLR